jgi:hypothetical protein
MVRGCTVYSFFATMSLRYWLSWRMYLRSREMIMKYLSLFGAAALLIASAGLDEASAQRGGRGFGGAGFRGGMVGGGFRGVGMGAGFRGAGFGPGYAIRGAGWRTGVVGRPGWGVGRVGWARPGWGWAGRRWGWGYPLAAGIAAAGYYYGSGYSYDSCLAWNGYRWVDVCYSGYYPYGYW